MWRWVKGRQNTGYNKLKIFQFNLGFHIDCYLLKYVVGDSIPWHTDPVLGHKHYRLNITLVKPKQDGLLYILNPDGTDKKINQRITFFRSDIEEHRVSRIRDGKRIVLTFGLAIKNKEQQ